MASGTNINPTLTAAQSAGAGTHKGTTRCLLEALKKEERDSDLGLLASALLRAGGYHIQTADDMEFIETHTDEIVHRAELIAAEYQQEADYCMSPLDT